MQPFTDLDGRSTLEFLKVGIDISNLTYVRPGESIEGAINLDTAINSAWFTMNQLIPPISTTTPKEQKEVTSTAEIVYKTMVELGKLEKSGAYGQTGRFCNQN